MAQQIQRARSAERIGQVDQLILQESLHAETHAIDCRHAVRPTCAEYACETGVDNRSRSAALTDNRIDTHEVKSPFQYVLKSLPMLRMATFLLYHRLLTGTRAKEETSLFYGKNVV